MSERVARKHVGVEDQTKLNTILVENDVAKREGKSSPHLSLDLDQPPPHKKGGFLSTLFSGNKHPSYVNDAVRKVYHDPGGPFGVAAQEKLLAYTAAHTAPIKGMNMSVDKALKATPAPRYGLLKGTIPHASSSWGHAGAPPKIKKALVLKNERHNHLEGLFASIGDGDARRNIRSIFTDRFDKQKAHLDAVAKVTAKATANIKTTSNAKANAEGSSFSINGGRRGRSTRKGRNARRQTKRGNRIHKKSCNKSCNKRSRRKKMTRRH